MTQGFVLTLLALLLYGVWGFSYKLLSLKEIQGEWVVALVMLFGAAISASLAMARSDPFPFDKISGNIPWLVLAALSGAVGNIFLVKAMAFPGLSSGVVLAISGAYPLVAALLAYFFLSEQLTSIQAIGTAAIVFGVGLLMFK
ncbi:MAG: EamA family transporter [Sulfurimicrobium sp.]|nr:EamA family transporter [Sulfurimicrobium sp.]MDO9188400.1 EamA family transporter [Sulfurimicrobium sp.]MDP1703452.1 EamA family transporter [Sulfurimicrobium sp.]MDP1896837.1 EamA family transporter [Sulfurimicrobium sp.]MDP2197324.1 EamA family transporter [Sulfurimicrobium sp.]